MRKKVLGLVMLMLSAGLLGALPQSFAAEHRLFTELLLDHVEFGLVDYKNLCDDPRLKEYTARLSATDPDAVESPEERIAFWLNAYNAFMLEIVCRNYPIESVNELHAGGMILGSLLKKTVWDKPFITIHGETYTLNTIEHEILRKEYDDPRIHFALVCAAYSCPPLRYEAYEGEKLDVQLNDQARVFLNNEERNAFDREKRIAWISSIFAWFAGDFGGRENLLTYIVQFLPDALAKDIKDHPDAWKIRHRPYSWALNDTRLHF